MEEPEEEGANSPLLIKHSIKKRIFSKKIRPVRTFLGRFFTTRFSMKKLFLCSVIASLLLLGYLMSKSSWMFNYYSYQYSAPRLKAYAACVVRKDDFESLWLKSKDLHSNDSLPLPTTTTVTTTAAPKSDNFERDNYQHRRIVLIVSKTSYSSAFKSVSEILVANRIKYKVCITNFPLLDFYDWLWD